MSRRGRRLLGRSDECVFFFFLFCLIFSCSILSLFYVLNSCFCHDIDTFEDNKSKSDKQAIGFSLYLL